ncbi:MAG: McrB family protein [Solirubrobacteraceae bacterium]
MKSTKAGADALYQAAGDWIAECLNADGSLLTPGRSIWTEEGLGQLTLHFVENPDLGKGTYLQKLEGQVGGLADDVIQLMAELHVVYYLIISSDAISTTKKRADLAQILGWMSHPVDISDSVGAALDAGLANPGQWALTRRDTQIAYLVAMASAWKQADLPERERISADPWLFKQFVDSVESPSAESQRNALLHVVFPEDFEPITSVSHKRALVTRFAEFAGATDDDIDRRIAAARAALTPEYGEEFNWYHDPLVHLWWRNGKAWKGFMRWAQKWRAEPDFDQEERDYKLQAAARVAALRSAVAAGSTDWLEALSAAFHQQANNLTNWRAHDKFLEVSQREPERVREALVALWSETGAVGDRLGQFIELLPPDALPTRGSRLNIGSFLLTGQDPTGLPVVKVRVLDAAWRLAGWGPAPKGAREAQYYERALAFLDELLREGRAVGMDLRDRLDAQGVVWMMVRTTVPPSWSDADREQFELFRTGELVVDEDDEGAGESSVRVPSDERSRRALRYRAIRDAWTASEDADTETELSPEAKSTSQSMLDDLDRTRDLSAFVRRMGSDASLPAQLRTGAHLVFVAGVAKATTDATHAAAVIADAYRVPQSEAEAERKITELAAYIDELGTSGQPTAAMAPLAASVFWSLQDPAHWPALWSSAEEPARTLSWLEPSSEPAERYLRYIQVLAELEPSEPMTAARCLSWYGKGNFAGVDPTATARCTDNVQFGADFYEHGQEYSPEADAAARMNARAVNGDLRLVGKALVSSVADALGTELKWEVSQLRYGKTLPYRYDAFVAWTRGTGSTSDFRLWITKDGVGIGLWPRFHGVAGWYTEAGQLLADAVPDGLEFFKMHTAKAVYEFVPTGITPPDGAFLLGVWTPIDQALQPDFSTIVVDVATKLAPLLARLDGDTDRSGPETETEGPGPRSGDEIDYLDAAAQALLVERDFLVELQALLEDKGQIILYGPPGTGKTYLAQRLAIALAQNDASAVSLVQFHPSSSYEDFFEGLRPQLTAAEHVTYALTSGPLMLIAEQARREPDRTFVMVIDEINRANLAKVFGELLFLLEYRDRAVHTLYRPDTEFTLPKNLWFIGTMNTADRSIALVDAAMRRRFHFVPFFPSRPPIDGLLERWLDENHGRSEVAALLRAVNDSLVATLGEHMLIGPSHFMRNDLSDEALRRIWDYNVFPYIEEQLWGNGDEIDQWRWVEVRRRLGQLLGDQIDTSGSDLLAEAPAEPESEAPPAS